MIYSEMHRNSLANPSDSPSRLVNVVSLTASPRPPFYSSCHDLRSPRLALQWGLFPQRTLRAHSRPRAEMSQAALCRLDDLSSRPQSLWNPSEDRLDSGVMEIFSSHQIRSKFFAASR